MRIIGKFFTSEYAVGIVLILAASLAMVMENSIFSHQYHNFLHFPIEVNIPGLSFPNTAHHWVNDGLMAIFFMLVGIEIKREMIEGHLSKLSQILLPGIAALGGMIVPALIFVGINLDNPEALSGWAIPSATDIAFAVGVISLLGKRVPYPLKLFLLAVAVIDDLGAIVIIAVFYSGDLDITMLFGAACALLALIALNWAGIYRRTPYVIFGILLWYFIFHSGIHATIAGVLIAFTIPISVRSEKRLLTYLGVELREYYGRESPAVRMEYSLAGIISFIVLPLFAFTNSGVPLAGMSLSSLASGVPLGVMAGLLFGKTIGIFLSVALVFKLGIASMPERCDMRHFLGVAMLCGIGFTMSLFIVSLSYSDMTLINGARLGILCGSLLSAILGYLLLSKTLAKDSITH